MKIVVGVKYCGHCNSLFEGPEVIDLIISLAPDLEFVSWQAPDKDVLLILSGCRSDCATRPFFSGPVVHVAGSAVERTPCSLQELPGQIEVQIKEKGAAG